MSIWDTRLVGSPLKLINKLDIALEFLKEFEPEEGYWLAFSGGKDSCVIKHLAAMARVKHESHYAITTVDPPELTRFIKKFYSDVERHAPPINMWDLIVKKKMPPTRMVRYCCEVLKEEGGNGRFVITGVRKSESSKRSKRKGVEFDTYGSQSKKSKENRERFNLMNDNDEKRMLIETCSIKGKNIINPIIDWSDEDVWEFIKYFNIPYCELYDDGFDRLGCIGCPLAGAEQMKYEFKRFPNTRRLYIKAFERMIVARLDAKLPCEWKTGEDVMKWWLSEGQSIKIAKNQIRLNINEEG